MNVEEEEEEEEKEGDRKVRSFGIQKINRTMNMMFGNTMQIWLTDYNSGTTHKLSFAVNTVIELKNITTTSDNTGRLVS
jgi:hypothetical protein